MSTTGSPENHGINLSLPALDQTTAEAPEEIQCTDGFMCEEESKTTQETSLQVEDLGISKAQSTTSHCGDGKQLQSEEAWNWQHNFNGQTVHQPAQSDCIGALASDELMSACEDHRRSLQQQQGECLQPKRRVAVTGAGGFIASWIVKLLLQRGFYVRATLRHIDDENTMHLRSLEGASERLEIWRANILHLPSLVAVVQSCEGVFHTACPVLPVISDPEAQMLRPAVEGTLNVLRACAQAHVKRVVMTSSIGAVYMNPHSSLEQVFDESCWSDENYLKDLKEWYCLAKLMAERMAWDYARTHNVNLVTICPGVTLGTMLQPHINQSSIHILKYLNGSTKTYANLCQVYVDVEDAAEAHVLAFVTPTAKGRYLCCKWSCHRGQLVDALARLCPHFPIPTRCKDESQPKKVPLRFCTHKVEQLGLQFTAFNQTLTLAVSSLQAKGLLQNKTKTNMDDPSPASKCTGSIITTTIPQAYAVLFPTVAQATQLVITSHIT